jgi:predicted MFS family arabinose efflux permease
VPLRLLRARSVSGGNLVVFLLGSCAFGMSYTLSQYGQGVVGYSPLRFGLYNVVMPATAVIGSYAGQALVTRIGARPVAVGGLALVGAGSLLLAGVPVDGRFVRDLFPGLLVFGPGLGACAVAGSIAALTGVGERESGVASGINTAAFQIGGAFGVAVVTSVAVSCTGGPGLAGLTAGYRAAFTACAVLAAIGLGCALALLRRPEGRCRGCSASTAMCGPPTSSAGTARPRISTPLCSRRLGARCRSREAARPPGRSRPRRTPSTWRPRRTG